LYREPPWVDSGSSQKLINKSLNQKNFNKQ